MICMWNMPRKETDKVGLIPSELCSPETRGTYRYLSGRYGLTFSEHWSGIKVAPSCFLKSGKKKANFNLKKYLKVKKGFNVKISGVTELV